MTWAKKPEKQKKLAKRDLELQWPILARCVGSWASKFLFSTHSSYAVSGKDDVPESLTQESSQTLQNSQTSTTVSGSVVPQLANTPIAKPRAASKTSKNPKRKATPDLQSTTRKKVPKSAATSSKSLGSPSNAIPPLPPTPPSNSVTQLSDAALAQLPTPKATPKKRLGTSRAPTAQVQSPAVVRSKSFSPIFDVHNLADTYPATHSRIFYPFINRKLQSPYGQEAGDNEPGEESAGEEGPCQSKKGNKVISGRRSRSTQLQLPRLEHESRPCRVIDLPANGNCNSSLRSKHSYSN